MQTLYKTLEDGTQIFVDDEGFYIEALEQKFYGTIRELRMRSKTIECLVLDEDGQLEKRTGFTLNGKFYTEGDRVVLSSCLNLSFLTSEEYPKFKKVTNQIDDLNGEMSILEETIDALIVEQKKLIYKFTLWQQ